MRYAALAPGKRIRPVLTVAVAQLLGRDDEATLDVAGAVELVHGCSLVLDDLPSMDDAALRRGRPTTHRRFGEATALLAAFALLVRAFGLLSEASRRLRLTRYGGEDLIHCLASAIGAEGLVAGQALDLASRPGEVTLAGLELTHSKKTGALFVAAAELGAMAADARRRELEAVGRFAKNLGLAFQIQDDLLDAVATAEEAGKDVGQDREKATFVGLVGLDGARSLADELLSFAEESLAPFGRRAETLSALVGFVAAYGRR